MRSIAQEVTKETGQVVVVDNKAGANGIIASQYAAHAAPDGYTVFVTTNTTHASNPYMYKNLPYDPVKDFSPVTALVKGDLLPHISSSTRETFKAMEDLVLDNLRSFYRDGSLETPVAA